MDNGLCACFSQHVTKEGRFLSNITKLVRRMGGGVVPVPLSRGSFELTLIFPKLNSVPRCDSTAYTSLCFSAKRIRSSWDSLSDSWQPPKWSSQPQRLFLTSGRTHPSQPLSSSRRRTPGRFQNTCEERAMQCYPWSFTRGACWSPAPLSGRPVPAMSRRQARCRARAPALGKVGSPWASRDFPEESKAQRLEIVKHAKGSISAL